MRQFKTDRCLVGVGRIHRRPTDGQKASVVLLVSLNLRRKYLKAIKFGRILACNGRRVSEFFFGHLLCRRRRIRPVYHFDIRIVIEEILALLNSDWVRVNLCDVLNPRTRQSHKVLRDVKVKFANHLQFRAFEQQIVLQNAASNGVLDGHNAVIGSAVLNGAEQVAELVTIDSLNIGTEILPCGYFVEGSVHSLNCNFHIHFQKKSPAKRGACIHYHLHEHHPASITEVVKEIISEVRCSVQHCFLFLTAQK